MTKLKFLVILIITICFKKVYTAELNTNHIENNENSIPSYESLETNDYKYLKYLIYRLMFKIRMGQISTSEKEFLDPEETRPSELDEEELMSLLNYLDEANPDSLLSKEKRGNIYKPRQGRSSNKYRQSNNWFFRRLVDKKAYYKPRMG